MVKKATLVQATLDWDRAQKLYAQEPKGIAKAEYDMFRAAFGTATAQLEVSKEANIALAEANQKTALTNLTITRRFLRPSTG